MKRALSGVSAIVLGLAVLAAGIFNIVLGVGRLQKMNSGNYVETQATITKIETIEVSDPDSASGNQEEYDITIEYSVDGKKAVAQLNETPKDFYEGMELTVLYNVDKPTDVILPGNGGAYIMIGLGVVSILAFVLIVLRSLSGR